MIEFKIQFKPKSRIFIQKNIHSIGSSYSIELFIHKKMKKIIQNSKIRPISIAHPYLCTLSGEQPIRNSQGLLVERISALWAAYGHFWLCKELVWPFRHISDPSGSMILKANNGLVQRKKCPFPKQTSVFQRIFCVFFFGKRRILSQKYAFR